MFCVGCGFCCTTGPCFLAVIFHPIKSLELIGSSKNWSCPELQWNGTRHLCKVWRIYNLLGEDKGLCLTSFKSNNWRFKPLKDRTKVTREMLYNGDPRGK
jgi:hypothetical protein